MSLFILYPVLALLVLFVHMSRFKKAALPLALIGLVAGLLLSALGLGLEHPILQGMASFDGYARAFGSLLVGLTFLAVLLVAMPAGKTEIPRSENLALLLLSLTGAIMLVSYQNLVMLFLGIETLSIPVYVLAGSKKHDEGSNEAALKYFLNGSFATGVLLFGIGLLYAGTGQFGIEGILAWSQANAAGSHPLFLLGLLFVLFGLAFKVSAAPFHFWTPDVYEGAPSVVTAYMSTAVKVAAVAAFYRLLSRAFPAVGPTWTWVILVLAVLTLLVGNLGALAQGGFKRLMAYSGISHAGYLLIALLATGPMAAGALWLYSAAYGAATMIAFTAWARIEEEGRGSPVEAFAGLGKSSPFLAVALSVAMFSLVGLPPLGGFMGKLFVFGNAVAQGQVALVVFAVVMSALGMAYYMRPVIQAWFQAPAAAGSLKLRAPETTVLVLCLLVIFALAALPRVVLGAFM